MVPIGSTGVCIDEYEATVYADTSCTGTRYGESFRDYPCGFPALVESTGCTGVCSGRTTQPQTTPVYACSVAGVTSSRYITWFQARRACENAGKRLCSESEWEDACDGTVGSGGTTYPYGDTYQPTTCNGEDCNCGSPGNTGALAQCVSSFGAYDMSGNLWEWTEDCWYSRCTPDPYHVVRGGSFDDIEAGLSCGDRYDVFPAYSCGFYGYYFGFRCCL